MSTKESVELIPKIELHCHLLGVIGPGLLRRISNQRSILVDPDRLEAIYPVLGTTGFSDWIKFMAPYQTASADVLLDLLVSHIADLIAQRVVYTELMISPRMFPPSVDGMLESFAVMRDRLAHFEQSDIQVEFIMVIPRTLPEEKLRTDVEAYIELHRAGCIAGVALVGLETGEPLDRFRPFFWRLKNEGIKLEIHAGEHYGPDSVREVVQLGVADRIGHCISAFADPGLVRILKEKQTHIEFCLTSNLKTGSVISLEQHPVRLARELGLNFSVNTDDPGMFDCSMNSEFQLLSDYLDFTIEDFRRIYHHSKRSAFAKELKRFVLKSF